jgi:Bacterial protein of unknown function (DUF899)
VSLDARGDLGPESERSSHDDPPIVSPQEWEAARQDLLVKEKELTRARDALAAERRRMPWLAVDKAYAFEGPDGRRAWLTCSMAAVSCSSTAPSTGPRSPPTPRAAPLRSGPVWAARSSPTRSPTPPT